jgi:hypothetical protein
MLTATILAVFLVPVFFVAIRKMSKEEKNRASPKPPSPTTEGAHA